MCVRPKFSPLDVMFLYLHFSCNDDCFDYFVCRCHILYREICAQCVTWSTHEHIHVKAMPELCQNCKVESSHTQRGRGRLWRKNEAEKDTTDTHEFRLRELVRDFEWLKVKGAWIWGNFRQTQSLIRKWFSTRLPSKTALDSLMRLIPFAALRFLKHSSDESHPFDILTRSLLKHFEDARCLCKQLSRNFNSLTQYLSSPSLPLTLAKFNMITSLTEDFITFSIIPFCFSHHHTVLWFSFKIRERIPSSDEEKKFPHFPARTQQFAPFVVQIDFHFSAFHSHLMSL